jgi:hypothetical protein
MRHENASDWGKVTLWCCDSWPDTWYDGGQRMAQPTRDIPSPRTRLLHIHRTSPAPWKLTSRSQIATVFKPAYPRYTLPTDTPRSILVDSKQLSRTYSIKLRTVRKSFAAHEAIAVTKSVHRTQIRIRHYVVPHRTTPPPEAFYYFNTCSHCHPYGDSRSRTTQCRD